MTLDAFKINVEERDKEEKGKFQHQFREFKECKKCLLDSVWSFKQKFKGLQNIRKFTSSSVVDRLEYILL